MISISDNLHQLAVAVAGGLSPLTFLSRGARAPLAPLVPTPLRVVDEDLCSNLKRILISTRDHFLDEHPRLKMYGSSFTCSSSIIDDM